jgi:hypothetical protein
MLERSRSARVAPLEVLQSTGYVRKEQDLLKARHPAMREPGTSTPLRCGNRI